MNRNSIRWRLPISYTVIALLAALSLGSVMLLVLKNYYALQEQDYLHGNAIALQPILEQIIQSEMLDGSLEEQIKGLAFLSRARIRLMDARGTVLADSGLPDSNQVVAVSGAPMGMVMFSVPVEGPGGQAPNLVYGFEGSAAPQVAPFEGVASPGESDIVLRVNSSPYGYGFVEHTEVNAERRSNQKVSVPLRAADGSLLGELEFSSGPSYGANVIRSVTLAWLVASVFAIAVAALTGWFMSQRVTRPVLALENATRQMEQGNLSVRVELSSERQQEFTSLANSFNGMAAQVEQTISTLRAFVADAAHELHTPLTALQANLELARDEKNDSERARYLSRAREQGQRLEAMVTSLLDLSRIEAAESRSDFARVDIVQLVREASEQFASRAEQTERLFTVELPTEAVYMQGNPSQLRQIVVNLLENALKFTPAHGAVSLKLEASDEEILLTVSDTGIGIPPEDLSHLFERFHRARNVAEYPGNGLGLAIVKAIVDAHAGSVQVRNQESTRGSTFMVKLARDS